MKLKRQISLIKEQKSTTITLKELKSLINRYPNRKKTRIKGPYAMTHTLEQSQQNTSKNAKKMLHSSLPHKDSQQNLQITNKPL